jgi:hypothetical protein
MTTSQPIDLDAIEADRVTLKAAPQNSDDWDDKTWAAWWRTAERVHGDAAVSAAARP